MTENQLLIGYVITLKVQFQNFFVGISSRTQGVPRCNFRQKCFKSEKIIEILSSIFCFFFGNLVYYEILIFFFFLNY